MDSDYSFLNFWLTCPLVALFKSWEVSGPYGEEGSYKLVEPQLFFDHNHLDN